jgi:UPF0755 protein
VAKKRPKKRHLFAIATFLSCAVAMSAGASLYIFRNLLIGFARAPHQEKQRKSVRVVVDRGMTARDVAQVLADKGVVGDATLFYRYVRFVAKKQDALKAGEYDLSPDLSPEEILDVLERGRDAEVRVVVPEGSTKKDFARLLADQGVGTVDENLAAMEDPALRASFEAPDDVPGGIEGYLFPDTYAFAPGTPPKRALKRMRARLDEVLDGPLDERRRALNMSLHELLTLASIVEKETGKDDERPRIAGVFLNRVKKRMKLQTDPTVIYGLAKFDGDLKREHLREPHPYNTYVHDGLPPGPICSPGAAALRAVLYPTTTDDLFFVSKGDGSHEFCPTLDCHEAAVRKFQLR